MLQIHHDHYPRNNCATVLRFFADVLEPRLSNEGESLPSIALNPFAVSPSMSSSRICQMKQPFTCEVCDQSFSVSSTLRVHQRIHTGEKPFTCKVCDKSFSVSSTLRVHQRVHTGEKPFRCKVCDQSFSKSSTLHVHQRTHTGEKPFRCEVCDKSFPRSSTLRRHQRVHTGEKPFRCEVCDKSFSQLSNLRRHQCIRTGEKPFMFEVCDKSFSWSSTSHQHQCVLTGEKPFSCKVNLAHNTQEYSLTGEQVPYIKELTEQKEFMRKLFGLSNPTITSSGSDMGMSEVTQVSINTSEGDGGDLTAASEIPKRANEEGTDVYTSQQCGMAAAVEEGEDCQESKMSNLERSVDELKLNVVVCVKEEVCDIVAAVVKEERSESSGGEQSAVLGAEIPPSPRTHGQHQTHATGEENENDPKPLACLHQGQIQSTESYQAISNLLQQTLTEFKTEVRQNMQRNNEILQQLLQRNNEIFQQQNEILCQVLQQNSEILNEMRQILSLIVASAAAQ